MAADTLQSPSVKLTAAMVTDVGVVRDHNEDSAHVDPQSQFFIVADGMGGHAAGEVASAMAVDTVKKTLEVQRARVNAFAKGPTEDGRRELVQLLQSAVLAAHQAVFQRGQREADKQGMGTTLDVLLIAGSEAFVAHVGDSRTYLIRDGRASQITTDHTVAEVLVIEGKLTIEEAQVSPLRTILVNAIGVSADVGVEMAHLQLRPADRLLLCSDGLHDYFLAETEIAERLSVGDPRASLFDMVELAKERGGHDNITGVIIQILDLRFESDGVPGMVDRDETLPVDAKGWSDDENTENLSVKELGEDKPAARPDETEPMPRQDGGEASRPTMPMTAVPSLTTTLDGPPPMPGKPQFPHPTDGPDPMAETQEMPVAVPPTPAAAANASGDAEKTTEDLPAVAPDPAKKD